MGTAVSPPKQTKGPVGGRHSAADEASLEHDLLGHVRGVSCPPRNETLDAIASILGTRIEDENLRKIVAKAAALSLAKADSDRMFW